MKLTCIKVIPYLKMGELVHGELKNHIYIFLHILFFNWLGGFILKKICKNDLYSSAQTYHHSWPTSFKINQAMRFTICYLARRDPFSWKLESPTGLQNMKLLVICVFGHLIPLLLLHCWYYYCCYSYLKQTMITNQSIPKVWKSENIPNLKNLKNETFPKGWKIKMSL